MDLIGVEAGGGIEGEAGIIIGLATRQAPGAVIALGLGFDRIERGEQGLEAFGEGAGQRRLCVRDQLGLLSIRCLERADLLLEIGEQGRVRPLIEGRAADHLLRVCAGGGEHHLGRDDALRRLIAHLGRDLVHHPLAVAQAGDIGLGIRDAVDPMFVDQEDRDIACGAAIGGHGEGIFGEGRLLLRRCHLCLEQAIAEARRGAEPFGREAAMQFGELLFLQRQGASVGPFAIIVQLAIVGLEAKAGHRFRAERQLLVERLVEEGEQRLVFLCGRRCGRRGWGLGWGFGQDRGGGAEGKEQRERDTDGHGNSYRE